MRRGLLFTVLLGGCIGGVPPLMREAQAPTATDSARVVIAWEPTSCDAGGDFAVATPNAFLGFIRAGTRLETTLPPGRQTIFVWSPDRLSEGARSVGVLHADLVPQRTYTATLSFGDWNEQGPRSAVAHRSGRNGRIGCGGPSPELVVVRHGDRQPPPDLRPISLDANASGPWAAEHKDDLNLQAGLAEERFEDLTVFAKTLATFHPVDGVDARVP
jgi:hypothetical protein